MTHGRQKALNYSILSHILSFSSCSQGRRGISTATPACLTMAMRRAMDTRIPFSHTQTHSHSFFGGARKVR